MSDYEKNKLAWWLLILAMIDLIAMIPLSILCNALAIPLIIIFYALVLLSVVSRNTWSGPFN